MAGFEVGQTVHIPCELQPGPFPTEYLVTFEAVEGPVSGFVRAQDVSRNAGGKAYISALVKEISADTLTVIVKGSFFTTTGLAHLNSGWANSNVLVAHA
jgi:hypothetical protein